MVHVVISGLPININYSRFLAFINGYIDDAGPSNQVSWDLIDEYTKQVTLNVKSNDARKLRRALDGYVFSYGGQVYPLICRHEADMLYHTAQISQSEVEQFSDSEASIPVDVDEELKQIDQKIELVKKKRILLEEESKLLLEKKRLEILENIGPNDLEKLKMFEEVKNPNVSDQVKEHSNSLPKSGNNKPIQLPSLYGSRNAIITEMKGLIGIYKTQENKKILIWLLRATVMKRLLGVVREKRGNLMTRDIVPLYRLQYPTSKDESFLRELASTINQTIANNIDVPTIDDMQVREATPAKTTILLDPDDVDAIVDMENDLDDWVEDVKELANTVKEDEVAKNVENNKEAAVGEVDTEIGNDKVNSEQVEDKSEAESV